MSDPIAPSAPAPAAAPLEYEQARERLQLEYEQLRAKHDRLIVRYATMHERATSNAAENVRLRSELDETRERLAYHLRRTAMRASVSITPVIQR